MGLIEKAKFEQTLTNCSNLSETEEFPGMWGVFSTKTGTVLGKLGWLVILELYINICLIY